MNVEREAKLVLLTLAVPFSLPHYHKTQSNATENQLNIPGYIEKIFIQQLEMLVQAIPF